MLDVHSHILPGIDDGAQDVETALAMGRMAMEEGISHICATPHHFGDGQDPSKETILKKVKETNALFQKEGVSVEILPGSEVYLTLDLPAKLQRGEVLSLNQGPYILVEFPMGDVPLYVEDILYEIRLLGYLPIIAHPERYRRVIQNPNLVKEWVKQGNYIQVNASSIRGKMGKQVQETAKILLQHHMVHFIGTDAHSTGVRSPKLKGALKEMRRWIGPQETEQLAANGNAIIEGKQITILPPRTYEEKKKNFLKTIGNLFTLKNKKVYE